MKIEDFYKNDGFNDLSEIIKSGQDRYRIDMQEDDGWRCYLMKDVLWHPPEGKAPNWFHRKMQQLFFGFKWFNENRNS